MKKITLLLFVALTFMLNEANAQATVYSENFETNVVAAGDGQMYTFAPSTKSGTWIGGVDLVTAGDADMNLRQGWGAQFNLKILTTGGAAVTIPNIDVAGYTNLTLSYDFVLENAGDNIDVAPFIEVSIDGGTTWTTLATVASGSGWNKATKSIALPAGTYKAISIRLNPNNVTANDAMFDNIVIYGTAPTLYSENFESDFPGDGEHTFAPSTKIGTWIGGKDLVTAGDAPIILRQGWESEAPNYSRYLLKILSTGAAVTIPNIDVTGHTKLKLSYEIAVDNVGPDLVPKIEASVDGGTTWTTLPTVVSPGGYSKAQKSVALPAGSYNTISLRMNPDAGGNDVMFDNFIITGPEKSAVSSLSSEKKDVFIVYPNPATNYILAENAQKVTITDLNGRIVKEALNSEKVDISSLSKGAYIVKVMIANSTKIGKLIKE